MKVDAITGFYIFELFHLQFAEKMQRFLFFLFQDAWDLRMVDELMRGEKENQPKQLEIFKTVPIGYKHINITYGCDPEVWNVFDDLISFLEEWFAQFIVFLLNLQNFLRCFLVQRINFVLTSVNLLQWFGFAIGETIICKLQVGQIGCMRMGSAMLNAYKCRITLPFDFFAVDAIMFTN